MTLAAARTALQTADSLVDRLSATGRLDALTREVAQLLERAEHHLNDYAQAQRKLTGFDAADSTLEKRPGSLLQLLIGYVRHARLLLSQGPAGARTAAQQIRTARRRIDAIWERCATLFNPFGLAASDLTVM